MSRSAVQPLAAIVVAGLLWAAGGGASAAARPPGPPAFAKCYACHSVDPAERNLPGPNLCGIFGRRAGTLPGFEFSPAMRASGADRGLVWTAEALDRFLADPEGYLPGTLMTSPGIRDPAERRALIDYFRGLRTRAPSSGGPACPGDAAAPASPPRP